MQLDKAVEEAFACGWNACEIIESVLAACKQELGPDVRAEDLRRLVDLALDVLQWRSKC